MGLFDRLMRGTAAKLSSHQLSALIGELADGRPVADLSLLVRDWTGAPLTAQEQATLTTLGDRLTTLPEDRRDAALARFDRIAQLAGTRLYPNEAAIRTRLLP